MRTHLTTLLSGFRRLFACWFFCAAARTTGYLIVPTQESGTAATEHRYHSGIG
jgi:hypothetical protein